MPRTIKKYENRKLYDLEERRYVSLREIAGIIRSGVDVRVVDNVTGDDVTPETLTKVIAETAGENPLLHSEYLHGVVRWGAGLISQVGRLTSRRRSGIAGEIQAELTQLRERLAELDVIVSRIEQEE